MLNGRSISSEVEAANSKLAALLRAREEDEQLLQIGKHKIRDLAKAEAAGRPRGAATRWALAADFATPVALPGRPRTFDGATTFSSSHSIIVREGIPLVRGRPLPGFDEARDPGVDHARYIHRDGAPERIFGAEHEVYVTRFGAAERLSLVRIESTGLAHGDAALASVLERLRTGYHRELSTGTEAVFSNISTYQNERENYWHAVHRCERKPRTHSLIVDPTTAPGWWADIETWPGVPDDFRAHCLAERDRHAEWCKQKEQGRKVAPFKAVPYEGDDSRCGEALVAARDVPGCNTKRPPVWFKSGRGGRVQYRWVFELPHEISAEDRAAIVLEFCHYLATLAKDENGRTIGMMYTAAIHKPDPHGDQRNFHVHIDAHDRPAQWLPEFGQWDFEVAETFNHRGETRTRYPHRQNKIPEVTRTFPEGKQPAHFNEEIAGAKFLPHLRKVWADINNKVLERRSVGRTIDPRSNAQLNFDRVPAIHLGTKASALERAGVPTIIGRYNSAAYWSWREREIERQAAAEFNAMRDEQDKIDKLADICRANGLLDVNYAFLRLANERRDLLKAVVAGRHALLKHAMFEEKVKSRALMTIRAANAELGQLKNGSASDKVRRNLEKRLCEARGHVEAVDQIRLPYRAAIDQAGKDLERQLERVAAIDRAMVLARAAIADHLHEPITIDASGVELRTPPHVGPNATVEPLRDAVSAKSAVSIIEPLSAVLNKADLSLPAAPRPIFLDQDGTGPFKDGVRVGPELRNLANAPAESRDERAEFQGSRKTRMATSEIDPKQQSPRGRDFAEYASRSKPAGSRIDDLQGAIRTGSEAEVTDLGPGLTRVTDAIRAHRKRARSNREHIDVGPIPPASRIPAASSLPRASSIPGASMLARVRAFGDGLRHPAFAAGAATHPIDGSRTEDARPAVQPAHDDTDRDAELGRSSIRTSTTEKPTSLLQSGSSASYSVGLARNLEKLAAGLSTQRAERSSWDEIIERIAADRIPIVGLQRMGAEAFEVPSLSPAEQTLLNSPKLRVLSQKRLRRIFEQQMQEIGRLVAWIAKHGAYPEMIAFEGRTARLRRVPKSVVTLWRHHKLRDEVKAALQVAFDRQIAAQDEERRTGVTSSRKPTVPGVALDPSPTKDSIRTSVKPESALTDATANTKDNYRSQQDSFAEPLAARVKRQSISDSHDQVDPPTDYDAADHDMVCGWQLNKERGATR